jgi:N-acyl-D-amino-acid deacylase
VLDQHGLALAPGFIDMHSHGSGGLTEDLDAATVSRQGITTILVGQDGESNFPLRDYFTQLVANPPAINLASMVGHATLREQVMGKDLYRPSAPQELVQMKTLLARELTAGAFGLSTGLEYEAAHFATTEEVVDLAKVAAAAKGFYISHVRDEASRTFDSFDELLRIGREAKLPVEITHIKMGSTSVWHQAAKRMPELFERARREGVDLKADVYPYTFWHSTIRVIVPDRDYFNPQKVEQALAENGGAQNIRIVNYPPEAALAGKTLAEIATHWQVHAGRGVHAHRQGVRRRGRAERAGRERARHLDERGRRELVRRESGDHVLHRRRIARRAPARCRFLSQDSWPLCA